MPFGDQQAGLFSPGNMLMMSGPMFMQTAGLTHMIRRENVFSGGRHSLAGLGRYASGTQSNVMMARKLTNQTMASKWYRNHAPSSISRLAPELSQLFPSRYLNAWAALAGSEGAYQGMGMQSATTWGRRMAGLAGDMDPFSGMTPGTTSPKSPMTSFGSATRATTSFYDTPITDLPGSKTWGDFLRTEGETQTWLRNRGAGIQSEAEWAKAALHNAGLYDKGMPINRGAGIISNKMSGLLIRGVGATGVKGELFRGVGKMIPAATRIGAVGFAAYDVYNISLMAGSLIGKAGLAMMKAPVAHYNKMTADIHRGTFMTSSPLSPFVGATSRQRAIADVYDRNLNLRQVLGNEAGYLANLGY